MMGEPSVLQGLFLSRAGGTGGARKTLIVDREMLVKISSNIRKRFD